MLKFLAILAALFITVPAFATTRTVGPGKTHATIGAAYTAASPNDTIAIYPSTYVDDAITTMTISKKGLVFIGIGTRPKVWVNPSRIDAGNAKAILNFDTSSSGNGGDFSIVNLEFQGAQGGAGNCAAMRFNHSGLANITMSNLYIHQCQDGWLGSASNVLEEYTTIDSCGGPVGPAHCMYMDAGGGNTLTIRYSYHHRAIYGHEVKSRAETTYLLYNRLCDETGDGTYVIDVPDCGRLVAIGNIIEQGPNSPNSNATSFGGESAGNVFKDMYYVNNTFINDKSAGTFIALGPSGGGTTQTIKNNIFYGPGTTIGSGGSLTQGGNFTEADHLNTIKFVNQSFDFHLTINTPSTVVNASVSPGTTSFSFSLTPVSQYVYDVSFIARPSSGTLDIGAFELSSSPSTTNSYFVPQAGPTINPGVLEGAQAIAYAVTCPNNDLLTNNARIKIVVKDSGGTPIANIQAVDIYASINGGPASQGFSGTGDDTLMASSTWQPLSGCPNVRHIIADAVTDVTGTTYITWKGSTPGQPGIATRDRNRKWGLWAGDIPIFVLGTQIQGRLTSVSANGSYTAHIKNIDTESGLSINAGEFIDSLDLAPIQAAIGGPYKYQYDFDNDGDVDQNDFNLVRLHLKHRCNYPNAN